MFCFVLVSFFIRRNKSGKDFFIFGGLCCAILLILFGIIISIAIRPFLLSRYLMPVCGLVWLFFAVECSAISIRRIIVFICTVLFIFGIISFSFSAHKEREENRISNTFYEYITGRIQEGDAFIFICTAINLTVHMPLTMNYIFPNHVYTFMGEKQDHLVLTLFGNQFE
jgi:hypothetical protein